MSVRPVAPVVPADLASQIVAALSAPPAVDVFAYAGKTTRIGGHPFAIATDEWKIVHFAPLCDTKVNNEILLKKISNLQKFDEHSHDAVVCLLFLLGHLKNPPFKVTPEKIVEVLLTYLQNKKVKVTYRSESQTLELMRDDHVSVTLNKASGPVKFNNMSIVDQHNLIGNIATICVALTLDRRCFVVLQNTNFDTAPSVKTEYQVPAASDNLAKPSKKQRFVAKKGADHKSASQACPKVTKDKPKDAKSSVAAPKKANPIPSKKPSWAEMMDEE